MLAQLALATVDAAGLVRARREGLEADAEPRVGAVGRTVDELFWPDRAVVVVGQRSGVTREAGRARAGDLEQEQKRLVLNRAVKRGVAGCRVS